MSLGASERAFSIRCKWTRATSLIHLYTALGSVVALLTLHAGLNENYRLAFVWMIVAVLIDSTDGPLARRYDIRAVVPQIDGRKLDDISDYANYTLVPIVLLSSRADWLPEPRLLWAGVPLVASLFTFAHTGAKEEGSFAVFLPIGTLSFFTSRCCCTDLVAVSCWPPSWD